MFAVFTDTILILLAGKCCMSEVTLSKNEYCKKFEDAAFMTVKYLQEKPEHAFRVCKKWKGRVIPLQARCGPEGG